jgi:integrase
VRILWRLRVAAAQREVWTGTQLRRLLAERAGLDMSSASVSVLFSKEPAQVKLSTLAAREPRGFTGQTLAMGRQRELFRRWTMCRDVHPHGALLGILALLHGASSDEVRHLRVSDIDQMARTARLGSRPRPVPLDAASWQVLQCCLVHRESWGAANPRVMVTEGTKAGRSPASTAYVSHLLDGCGVPPRELRCTHLADLVNTLDPKLVAAAFGMKPEGVMFYLADYVDEGRLST